MLLLLNGCSPSTSLKNLTNVAVSVGYHSAPAGEGQFTLSLDADDCPTLSTAAVLTVNGVVVPLRDPGGLSHGSYYLVPTTSCQSAVYELAPNTPPLPPSSSGLVVELSDGTATLRLTSAAAFAASLTRVDQAPVHADDRVSFRVSPKVAGLSAGLLWMRGVGEVDSMLVGATSETKDDLITLTMPTLAAKNYLWFLEASGQPPVDTCEGIAKCSIFATLDGEGTMTVLP